MQNGHDVSTLIEYWCENAKLQEGRLQSISTHAAAVAAGAIGVLAAVAAILGANELGNIEFVSACVGAGGTVIAAVFARARHPIPLTPLRDRQLENEEDMAVHLAAAEQGMAKWWSAASASPPQSLVVDAWNAKCALLSRRADSKETWLEASFLGLYITVVVPSVCFLIRLLVDAVT